MTVAVQVDTRPARSDLARRRFQAQEGHPLFVADWERALFIHYELPPALVQTEVPFPLDLFEGRAYVSLVAFTQRRFRFARLGSGAAWLMSSAASHEFLNLRTYVRHQGSAGADPSSSADTGIFFLAEWVPSRLALFLGPRLFGLPYRRGRLAYTHDADSGVFEGEVSQPAGSGVLNYHATSPAPVRCRAAEPGSLDEFLLERYVAFTRAGRTHRFFRIWHEPWAVAPAAVSLCDANLLVAAFPWFAAARRAGAHFSPGVAGVWIGVPRFVRR